ncbi:GntR family transcriptional regulator [Brachybacterium sp. YJGR34]|uniref:GntR family transcriptional regulator n=1 Tax=Brachybacterium sp. YJGR34 TaxID=2059911 RepID=UPI000E0B75B3|nr:GntR family transcriptional regulator [Brachybacterium sp. YJGR34]
MSEPADHVPEAARITARLRDEILDGVRAPGGRLVERELAEELGVSRVPVRDALKELAGEGLVTLRPRTWAVVHEFTAREAQDVAEAREALETTAFALAARRRTPEGLDRLRGVLSAELEAARRGDAVAARRAGADFHEVVLELADNGVLSEIGRMLGSRMRWFLSQHDDLLAIARDHERLCAAIAAQDAEEAQRLVAEHLSTSEALAREREEAPVAAPD